MASTPIAGESHDITLTDDAGTETGYMLWQDPEERAPRIVISRERPLAPQQFQGRARYTDQPPEIDLVWEINTFHRGGLSYRWTPEEDGRYNEADGIDCHTPGEFSLANSVGSTLPIIVTDGDMETAGVTSWTATQATLTKDTTIKQAGSQSLKLVGSGGAGTATQALDNPTAYRGGSITLIGYVYAVGSTGTCGLRIDDSAGNGSVATPTAADTWELVTATKTIAAGATSVTITCAGRADGATVYFDNLIVICNGATWYGALEFSDALYAAMGGMAVKWDETNDIFDAVVMHDGTGTMSGGLGISPTDDRIVAGGGVNTSEYYHSTTGTPVWTGPVSPQPSGPYVSVRNVVWVGNGYNGIGSSTDVSTPAFTSYTDIGTLARQITGIHAVNDIVVVGREDGLWVYNRVANDWSAADQFRNMTPEYQYAPHPDNFAKGIEWMGWLYLATRRGVLRYDGQTIQDMTHFFNGPQLADFGGRIRAFAMDGSKAYALMDTPSSDASATKTTWLLSFREVLDKETGRSFFAVHPIHKLSIGDLNSATVFYNGTDSHLYIFGRLFISGTTYKPVAYRLKIPARHDSPARDVTPELPTSGSQTLITQYWDGLMPTVTKALMSLNFRTEGCATGKSVTVAFEIDEDSSWTTLGSAVTTNGTQTLYFSTADLAKRTCKRVRFRFTAATDSATTGPRVICPVVLHTSYRPTRLRHYEFTIQVADNLALRNGGFEEEQASTLLTRLDGYMDDTWPTTLKEDEDGNGTATSHTMFVTDVQRWKLIDNQQTSQRVWLYRVTGSERVTS